MVRDFWIRCRAGFRQAVSPLKGLVVDADGQTRWVPLVGIVVVVSLAVVGLVVGVVQGVGIVQKDSTSAPSVEPTQEVSAPAPVKPSRDSEVLKGIDVSLNPPHEVTKTGRVAVRETKSPGDFAESYTRSSLTMDMSKDSAPGWIEGDTQWRTSFVPKGFEKWVWDEPRKMQVRTDVLNAWAQVGHLAPQMSGYTTGVFIDRELANLPKSSVQASDLGWAKTIDSSKGVHLVRVGWVASAFPTKGEDTNRPLQQANGTTELLVVCPGVDGYMEASCRVAYASDDPNAYISNSLKAWPNP